MQDGGSADAFSVMNITLAILLASVNLKGNNPWPMGSEADPDESLAELIEEGHRCRIFAYRDVNGIAVARVALEELMQKVQEAYAVRFVRMCSHGAESMKPEHYHKWVGDLRVREFGAFKDLKSKTRIPSFPDGPGIRILTHVITGKKEDKLKEGDILETIKIYQDYMQRKRDLSATKRAKRR
jgi:hypothetical protein